MEAFLDYVVKGLVDRPDAVQISASDRNGVTVYELRVHPTDMGKIIGRQGATINAIRALLLVGSAKKGVRCVLEVIDEEGAAAGERPSRPRERSDRPDRGDRGGQGGRDRGNRRGGFRGGRSGGNRASSSQPAREGESTAAQYREMPEDERDLH